METQVDSSPIVEKTTPLPVHRIFELLDDDVHPEPADNVVEEIIASLLADTDFFESLFIAETLN